MIKKLKRGIYGIFSNIYAKMYIYSMEHGDAEERLKHYIERYMYWEYKRYS